MYKYDVQDRGPRNLEGGQGAGAGVARWGEARWGGVVQCKVGWGGAMRGGVGWCDAVEWGGVTHGSTHGNVLITDLVARAHSGAAVWEAGGVATHTSLAGTQPHLPLRPHTPPPPI
ncbi:hypothetical protein DFH94DRAFT_685214 [Russula ochroleuca]|uniref:Uncharacterized protein n=1 Tax=Russula ochroleuca TaxID=152965 RepID=A0A9P5JYU5_9AGAM|nr:hypothetical protein DFH94DRAFT_685214 [Russula ochroleuca]